MRLNQEKLKKNGDALFEILLEPWMETPIWSDVHHMLHVLAKLMLAYVQYLDECCTRQKKANYRMDCNLKWDIINCEGCLTVDKVYLHIDSVLKNMKDYEFLELDEKFTPEDRQQRYLFFLKCS